jgi:DNA-directed RNA polymerase beta subunit
MPVSKINYRVNLGKSFRNDNPQDLTYVQHASFYEDFLQEGSSEKKNQGLEGALRLLNGISSNSGNMELIYEGYELSEPLFSIKDCKLRGTSYSAALTAKFKLFTYDKENIKKGKKSEKCYRG